MFKRFLSVLFLAMMGFVLASCGDDTLELKTISMFGGTDPHAETYEALLKEFSEENNVTISDSSATSDEIWKTSVISTFYTGTEPDVLFYFTGETAKPLVTNDKVVSIADIRKVHPDFAKNISESVMDPYAVPLKGFVEGVYVNTELFTGDLAPYLQKEVWTWDDYFDICEKLIEKDIVPFSLGATDIPHYWIEHLVLGMLGPDAFKDIKKSITDHKADWAKALKLMKTFADAGWFGPTKGNQLHSIADAAFKAGDTAMILDGSWLAGAFGDDTVVKPEKVKMMPFPAIPTSEGGKNQVYMQSGFTSGFYISKKAWNNPAKRDLCVKLVEKMTSTAAVAEFAKAGGVPADPEVELANLNNLQVSMNSMPSRTVSATLPLSDAAKAGTFAKLVDGANDYLTGNEEGILAALTNFVDLQ